MSTLRPKVNEIEIEDKKYPVEFNIAVIAELQEEFNEAIGKIIKNMFTGEKMYDVFKTVLNTMIEEGNRITGKTETLEETDITSENIVRILLEVMRVISESLPMSEQEEEQEEHTEEKMDCAILVMKAMTCFGYTEEEALRMRVKKFLEMNRAYRELNNKGNIHTEEQETEQVIAF